MGYTLLQRARRGSKPRVQTYMAQPSSVARGCGGDDGRAAELLHEAQLDGRAKGTFQDVHGGWGGGWWGERAGGGWGDASSVCKSVHIEVIEIIREKRESEKKLMRRCYVTMTAFLIFSYGVLDLGRVLGRRLTATMRTKTIASVLLLAAPPSRTPPPPGNIVLAPRGLFHGSVGVVLAGASFPRRSRRPLSFVAPRGATAIPTTARTPSFPPPRLEAPRGRRPFAATSSSSSTLSSTSPETAASEAAAVADASDMISISDSYDGGNGVFSSARIPPANDPDDDSDLVVNVRIRPDP